MSNERFEYLEDSSTIYDEETGLRYRAERSLIKILNRLNHESKRATPIENGKNRYGLDVSYFRNLIDRELNRGLQDYTPAKFARVCARMAKAADSSVLDEPEFKR